MSIVRAAVVQDAPVAFDRERTLEKVRLLTADAARDGAQLVVFPEAFVSAYPKGVDFGARVGMRSPEGREDFRRYWESAVDVPGPATQALAAAARDSQVHLVVGVVERDDDIARGKYDLDVVGHYARPDIFRLHVDERATPAVVSNSELP